MEQGIVPAGAGSLLHGLDLRLAYETGIPVVVPRDPLNCVAIGSGQCLEEFEALKQVLIVALTGRSDIGVAQPQDPRMRSGVAGCRAGCSGVASGDQLDEAGG